jgi:hypothetical protein
LRRETYDSPEEFYQEVSRFYQGFERTTPGKPTASIARAGGVPHSTAARWVREARRRGYLPAVGMEKS